MRDEITGRGGVVVELAVARRSREGAGDRQGKAACAVAGQTAGARQNSASIAHLARNRLTMRDRIELRCWEQDARGMGFVRVDVCDSKDDPNLGDFANIYEEEKLWASFSVGLEGGRYVVWRSATGCSLGKFQTLGEALAQVTARGARTAVVGRLTFGG